MTTEDILRAAAYAAEHPDEYDQTQWCGTPCNVAGHARKMLGLPQLPGVPKEYTETGPRADMLRTMMQWTHQSTAALMLHVRDDGLIIVPEGIPNIGANTFIWPGAMICEEAIIGSHVIIGPRAIIDMNAEISEHAEICHDAHIGPGVKIGTGAFIGHYARIGNLTVIGPKIKVDSYSRIGANSIISVDTTSTNPE